MVKNVRFLNNSIDTTYEISNLIKKSPKRDAMLHKIRKDILLEYPGFRVLCPTRWTVKAESMKSILDIWFALQQVWDETLDGNLEPEIKGRIIGVKSQMNTFNYFYGVTMMMMMNMMMNCLVVWLTNERGLALFPAGTTTRDPHHRESQTHRD